MPEAAAQQLALYLAAAKAALGVLPSQRRIVFERFFDEVGDTHLVIHSPYGSRINKASVSYTHLTLPTILLV